MRKSSTLNTAFINAKSSYMTKDTNFDQLAPRFQRNIYDSAKGKIRLAVLERDFKETLHQMDFSSAKVLDAGAGLGYFALQLAQQGANLTLCDISSEMLTAATQRFGEAGISRERYSVEHCGLQEIAQSHPGPYDLTLCHAVAEWLEQPEDVFSSLVPLLKEDGYFSLIFYNFNGLEFKNLLRTNFKRFNRDNFKSYRGSLTPKNPLKPEDVLAMSEKYGLTLVVKSGIRVFHDYVFNKQDREREPEKLLEKELQYSRLNPYWQLGRYIHFLLKK